MVTEIENQLLFDEGIAAKGRSLTEQMMNINLKDAYLHAFRLSPQKRIKVNISSRWLTVGKKRTRPLHRM